MLLKYLRENYLENRKTERKIVFGKKSVFHFFHRCDQHIIRSDKCKWVTLEKLWDTRNGVHAIGQLLVHIV